MSRADGDDLDVRRVAARRGDGDVGAELRAGEHERVADVVAVADVGEVEAGRGAEVLFEGHEVGQRLAGMLEVRERVDDGDARVGGHLRDGVVRVGAQDDDVDPALDVAGDVGDGLALAEGRVGLIDEDGVAAHGVDAGLKAEAGAQAGFLKHEDHLLGVEGMAVLARVALDVVAELEDGADFGAGEIGDGAHVFAGEARGGGENVGVLLHGNGGVRVFESCFASHGCCPP